MQISFQFCCSPSKQENNMNNVEKWAGYASHWKSRKLLFIFIALFYWTKLLQRKVQKALKLILTFQPSRAVFDIHWGVMDNSYYEPLPWFIIDKKYVNIYHNIQAILYSYVHNFKQCHSNPLTKLHNALFTFIDISYASPDVKKFTKNVSTTNNYWYSYVHYHRYLLSTYVNILIVI